MTQISILSGILADPNADFRSFYPRNLVPVPKGNGISAGYLRPAPGIVANGTGPGNCRGGINWKGTLYRVMGGQFGSVNSMGAFAKLGDVADDGLPVSMDYSFDQLAVASGKNLYYFDGANFDQVTDPDLGIVLDVRWIAGYFMTTDGVDIVVTDLTDPTSVNPLHYGSSEADPDPVQGVDALRGEAYAFNRYTIEVYENVGGDNFPFEVIKGAQVTRGAIGSCAFASFLSTFAFLGSGRGEPPAVYLMTPGDSSKISTREIDQVLKTFTEVELSTIVVETKADESNQQLLIHLPDRCLVYDAAASAVAGEPVWFTFTTSVVGYSQYRARHLVWCYDQWNCGDPSSPALGLLADNVSSHYGQVNGWEFGTQIIYNEGNGVIVHELELVALTGHVALGLDPVIWTSYSVDGETWSLERLTPAGKQGQRAKRIAWRRQGRINHWRIQKFRGTSDAHLSFARLEATMEALNS